MKISTHMHHRQFFKSAAIAGAGVDFIANVGAYEQAERWNDLCVEKDAIAHYIHVRSPLATLTSPFFSSPPPCVAVKVVRSVRVNVRSTAVKVVPERTNRVMFLSLLARYMQSRAGRPYLRSWLARGVTTTHKSTQMTPGSRAQASSPRAFLSACLIAKPASRSNFGFSVRSRRIRITFARPRLERDCGAVAGSGRWVVREKSRFRMTFMRLRSKWECSIVVGRW